MHLTATRITPPSWDTEGVGFDVPIKCLPGEVMVCMYPAREASDGGILLEGQHGAHGSKWQPDFGIVAKSSVQDVKPGDIVMVKPYDGLQFTHRDYDWIPEGRILGLYGRVAGDHWTDSVEAVIEL